MASTGIQFAVRRTRNSWSLSESDTKSLKTVDEEEMFLFDDEDLRSKAQPFRKTATVPVIHDLDNLDFSDGDNETSLPRKTENGIFHKRFHIFGDQFRAHSPADVASSADSETSTSISIEGLRDHLQSCFTCGVLWRENQASLDCHECDGYALERPCPDCDGNCSATWTRDLTITHQTHKAKWIGKCKLILRNSSIGGESCNSPLN